MNHLFRAIAGAAHVALAVSGGPDSMALMVLARRWLDGRTAPKITVLTVDHGLRYGSRAEADTVAQHAAALGLGHALLVWEGQKPVSRVQETAREVRYQLLADWCRRNGAESLILAHTIEDQAETILMRLARGTGIEGLAGMPVHRALEGVTLQRPLLHTARARLRAFLAAEQISWIEDPSNENLKFERIRIRKLMPGLAAIGLTSRALEETAFRARRADAALREACHAFIAGHVEHRPEGYCAVELAQFLELPDELRIRVLDRLILTYGPGPRASLSGLERLEAWFAGQAVRRKRATLAGCEIAVRAKSFLVGREPGRISGAPVPLKGQLVWDGRWEVMAVSNQPNLNVRPVAVLAGVSRNKQLPGFVQAGMPAICDGEKPICLPHSGQDCETAGIRARFIR